MKKVLLVIVVIGFCFIFAKLVITNGKSIDRFREKIQDRTLQESQLMLPKELQ